MANTHHKALFVKTDTHKKIKILAAKAGKTIDEFLRDIINKII